MYCQTRGYLGAGHAEHPVHPVSAKRGGNTLIRLCVRAVTYNTLVT